MSHDFKVSLNLTGKITTLSDALKKLKCLLRGKSNFLSCFLFVCFFSFPNWQYTQCYTYLRKDIVPVLLKSWTSWNYVTSLKERWFALLGMWLYLSCFHLASPWDILIYVKIEINLTQYFAHSERATFHICPLRNWEVLLQIKCSSSQFLKTSTYYWRYWQKAARYCLHASWFV